MLPQISRFTAINFLVVGLVMIATYDIMPYLGAGFIATGDNVLFGLRWIGLKHPTECAMLLGVLLGGAGGCAYGLVRSGKRSTILPIAIGAAVLIAVLAVAGLAYRFTMRPAA